ncbi:unnamed protein product [Dibothriocephalus latus]|uniref:Uncharacterized protein n=1 Tax=Dibothriocephalus latus TaxID=60516 RepID=A0A3P7NLD3_DIBLA|nr:unnamed protein product [Dibothriocephalus latus]
MWMVLGGDDASEGVGEVAGVVIPVDEGRGPSVVRVVAIEVLGKEESVEGFDAVEVDAAGRGIHCLRRRPTKPMRARKCQSTVVREQQVMNCSRGDARGGLHSANVEKVSVCSVGDADPGTLVTVGVRQNGREHETEECHTGEVLRTAELLHAFPKSSTIHRVERFHESGEQAGAHLLALLLQLSCGKDHVGGAAVTAKTTLAFRRESLFEVVVETVQENLSEDFAGNVEQRYSAMIVTDLTIPLRL